MGRNAARVGRVGSAPPPTPPPPVYPRPLCTRAAPASRLRRVHSHCMRYGMPQKSGFGPGRRPALPRPEAGWCAAESEWGGTGEATVERPSRMGCSRADGQEGYSNW